MAAITRIYADDDGQSHVEDLALSFGRSLYPDCPLVSTPLEATSDISYHRAEPGVSLGWNPAPRRQYIFVLAGQGDIETGDGAVRRFGPGDVMLVEDLTGTGHLTKFEGNEPCLLAFIPLVD